MKEFIPLCQLLWTCPQCTIPFSISLRCLCQHSLSLLLIWLQILGKVVAFLVVVAVLFLCHLQQSLWNLSWIFNLCCHVGSQLAFLPGLTSGPMLGLAPTSLQVMFPLSELQQLDSAEVPTPVWSNLLLPPCALRDACFSFCLNDLKIDHHEASEVRSKCLLFSLQWEGREGPPHVKQPYRQHQASFTRRKHRGAWRKLKNGKPHL